jgi:hypothetical protein
VATRRVAVIAVFVSLVSAQTAAADGWVLTSIPPPTDPNGQLSDVSCAAGTACMAVGNSVGASGYLEPLAEIRTRSSWAIQPTPWDGVNDSLASVSCPTSTDCIAVGWSSAPDATNATPTSEQWNGSAWSSLSTPNPDPRPIDGEGLDAVSCSSATACMALGGNDTYGDSQAYAEFWDGDKWTAQLIPGPSGQGQVSLTGISCTSSTACWAVGMYVPPVGYLEPLVEAWDGHEWTMQAVSGPAGSIAPTLDAISCTNASSCTAVGNYNDSDGTQLPWAVAWDGQGWSTEPTPDPAGDATLTGVSCRSSTSCVAVGTQPSGGAPDGSSFAEAWDGVSWSMQTTPAPTGATAANLAAVSCESSTVCTAVGGDGEPLAELSTGGSWSDERAAAPAPPLASELTSVSCTSITACTAVGSYKMSPPDPDHPTYAPGPWATLAESWNGRHWSVEPTPNAADANFYSHSSLSSVSCTSRSACMAVGSGGPGGSLESYAERWDGSTWSLTSIPTPADSSSAELTSVSCTADTACTGVGHSENSSSGPQMLAEGWDGSSWSIEPTTTPAGFESLNGLSCTSTTACMAVGEMSRAPSLAPLAEQLTGTTWASANTNLPGWTLGGLAAVSCVATGACVAVGGFATFDGTNWTSTGANGISCTSSTACIAVGEETVNFGIEQPYIESWDGTSWTPVPTPTLGWQVTTSLASVSCTAPTACVAVGNGYGPVGNGDDLFEETYVTGPATPVNTSLPTIAGSATEGQTLTETDGSWTQSPTKISHQWEDCNYYPACTPIAGATGATYTLTAADFGYTVCVEESASNSAYTGGSVCSAPTAVVKPIGTQPPPTPTTTTIPSPTTTTATTATPSAVTRTPAGAITSTTTTAGTTASATTTTPAPTSIPSGALRRLLLHAIDAHGNELKIPALLPHDGYSFTFTAPFTGRLVIKWQPARVGTARGAQKAERELIATTVITVQTGRTVPIKLTLTPAGRRLLKHLKRRRIVVTGMFIPVQGAVTTASERLLLTS